jgi:hypothetical protein
MRPYHPWSTRFCDIERDGYGGDKNSLVKIKKQEPPQRCAEASTGTNT